MNLINMYKNRSKKFFGPLFLFFCLLLLKEAGAQTKSEFSITAGGGFSQLDYELPQGGYLDNSRGGSLGIGYSFYLNTQWAINIAGEYESFKANAVINSLESFTPATDMEGESFEFRYTALNYEEQQKVQVINIPLTLQFQTDGETKFYTRIGAQASIIANAEYSTSIRSLSTSGYYAQYDAELFDPRFMGFGTFNRVKPGSGELELDTSFAAVAEAGVKREAGESSSFYIGLFINYGLNTINKQSGTASTLQYHTSAPTDFESQSILSSGYAEDLRLVSYGLKLRFAFGGF